MKHLIYGPKLHELAETLQSELRHLRQEAYYSEPRFHASFCWTLMKIPSENDEDKWSEKLSNFLEEKYGDPLRRCMVFNVDEIQTKIGKREHTYKLRSET